MEIKSIDNDELELMARHKKCQSDAKDSQNSHLRCSQSIVVDMVDETVQIFDADRGETRMTQKLPQLKKLNKN